MAPSRESVVRISSVIWSLSESIAYKNPESTQRKCCLKRNRVLRSPSKPHYRHVSVIIQMTEISSLKATKAIRIKTTTYEFWIEVAVADKVVALPNLTMSFVSAL